MHKMSVGVKRRKTKQATRCDNQRVELSLRRKWSLRGGKRHAAWAPNWSGALPPLTPGLLSRARNSTGPGHAVSSVGRGSGRSHEGGRTLLPVPRHLPLSGERQGLPGPEQLLTLPLHPLKQQCYSNNQLEPPFLQSVSVWGTLGGSGVVVELLGLGKTCEPSSLLRVHQDPG